MTSPGAPPAAPAFFGRDRVPVPSGREAAELDRLATESLGVPSGVLMESAGRAAAAVVARLLPRGRIIVVAGGGNNGGDGVVAARTLAEEGRAVELLVLGDPSVHDALLHGRSLPIRRVPDDEAGVAAGLAAADGVVDALLGTGIRGAPRAPHARTIAAMNRADAPVVSLDLPSGVDADTGAVPGEAVEAVATVAFGGPKLGTLLHPGRARAGRLIGVEIGFPPWPEGGFGARLVTPGWATRHRPRRGLVTHKNAEGRLLVAAGRRGMAGAAILAARAALRAGAGFVRVASPADNREILQAAVPEAVWVDPADPGALAEAVGSSDAVAAGPGWGTGAEEAERLDAVLAAAPRAVLLDADALTLLGSGRLPAFAGCGEPGRRLLTPHPGELVRIGGDGEEAAADPPGAARAAASRHAAAVLLKGTPSVVAPGPDASPDDAPVWISGTGSSDLARAGMGDVLTGAAGAFLARGIPAAAAAALALHFTGRAAERSRLGESLLPSDVIAHLPGALSEEGSGSTDLDLPFVLLDLGAPR